MTFGNTRCDVKRVLASLTYTQIELQRKRCGNAANRARRYGVLGVFTWHEWVLMLEASGGICAYCKQQVGIENLGIDHVLPMSLGGNHSAENIAASCFPCNCAKDQKNNEQCPDWRLVMSASVADARARGIGGEPRMRREDRAAA